MLIACGSPPDIDGQLDTVHSWTATAQLTANRRAAGAVTARYVEQVHERGEEALTESRTSLAEAAKSDDDRRRSRAAIDSLALALAQPGAEGGR